VQLTPADASRAPRTGGPLMPPLMAPTQPAWKQEAAADAPAATEDATASENKE